MQSINVAVLTPIFLTTFLGTAAACVLVIIAAFLQWHTPGAVCLFGGGALYLVGAFLVTIMFNVPKNNALAAVAADDPDSASLWASYLTNWTAWNHGRATAALAAAATLTMALG